MEGELIKAKLFDETNGKKDALEWNTNTFLMNSIPKVKNKKGQLCTNKPCKFGLKCRYLHRKIDMRTRETTDYVKQYSNQLLRIYLLYI